MVQKDVPVEVAPIQVHGKILSTAGVLHRVIKEYTD